MGATVVALDNNLAVIEAQQIQAAPMDRWSVYIAELIGIFYLICIVFKIALARSKPIFSARSSPVRGRSFVGTSTLSGSKNGNHPLRVVTYRRSIAHYQQATRGGYIGTYRGTAHTF
jgi:hypothetical protein